MDWHWWHFNAADYYGAHYIGPGKDGKEYEIWMDAHQWLIDQFLFVRKKYAYGEQYDYFDHSNCIPVEGIVVFFELHEGAILTL